MLTLRKDRALVLFSGGQDSSIALAHALNAYDRVETVGFDYGQRHAVELGARTAVRREFANGSALWRDRLGADTLIDLAGFGRISETAMTRNVEIGLGADGLPSTFVPGRNLVFLCYAAALAYRKEIGVLVGGMCEADFSGYPDCRAAAVEAQMEAIRLGMNADFEFDAPLMNIDKAASWRLAEKIGGRDLVEIVRGHTHTCYRGVRSVLHDWGYGCGACPACELRKAGWEKYRSERSAS